MYKTKKRKASFAKLAFAAVIAVLFGLGAVYSSAILLTGPDTLSQNFYADVVDGQAVESTSSVTFEPTPPAVTPDRRSDFGDLYLNIFPGMANMRENVRPWQLPHATERVIGRDGASLYIGGVAQFVEIEVNLVGLNNVVAFPTAPGGTVATGAVSVAPTGVRLPDVVLQHYPDLGLQAGQTVVGLSLSSYTLTNIRLVQSEFVLPQGGDTIELTFAQPLALQNRVMAAQNNWNIAAQHNVSVDFYAAGLPNEWQDGALPVGRYVLPAYLRPMGAADYRDFMPTRVNINVNVTPLVLQADDWSILARFDMYPRYFTYLTPWGHIQDQIMESISPAVSRILDTGAFGPRELLFNEIMDNIFFTVDGEFLANDHILDVQWIDDGDRRPGREASYFVRTYIRSQNIRLEGAGIGVNNPLTTGTSVEGSTGIRASVLITRLSVDANNVVRYPVGPQTTIRTVFDGTPQNVAFAILQSTTHREFFMTHEQILAMTDSDRNGENVFRIEFIDENGILLDGPPVAANTGTRSHTLRIHIYAHRSISAFGFNADTFINVDFFVDRAPNQELLNRTDGFMLNGIHPATPVAIGGTIGGEPAQARRITLPFDMNGVVPQVTSQFADQDIMGFTSTLTRMVYQNGVWVEASGLRFMNVGEYLVRLNITSRNFVGERVEYILFDVSPVDAYDPASGIGRILEYIGLGAAMGGVWDIDFDPDVEWNAQGVLMARLGRVAQYNIMEWGLVINPELRANGAIIDVLDGIGTFTFTLGNISSPNHIGYFVDVLGVITININEASLPIPDQFFNLGRVFDGTPQVFDDFDINGVRLYMSEVRQSGTIAEDNFSILGGDIVPGVVSVGIYQVKFVIQDPNFRLGTNGYFWANVEISRADMRLLEQIVANNVVFNNIGRIVFSRGNDFTPVILSNQINPVYGITFVGHRVGGVADVAISGFGVQTVEFIFFSYNFDIPNEFVYRVQFAITPIGDVLAITGYVLGGIAAVGLIVLIILLVRALVPKSQPVPSPLERRAPMFEYPTYKPDNRGPMRDRAAERAERRQKRKEQQAIKAEQRKEQQAIKAEQQRLRKIEEEKQRAERERLAAIKAAEQARERAERERLAAIQRAEQERQAAIRRAEQQRIQEQRAREAAAKRAEQERVAAIRRAEQERIAVERQAQAMREREERARAEAARRAEQERVAAARRAEQERAAAAKRIEQERAAAQRRAEQERAAAARQAQAQAERQQREREVAERRAEQERVAAARQAQAQADRHAQAQAQAARQAQAQAERQQQAQAQAQKQAQAQAQAQAARQQKEAQKAKLAVIAANEKAQKDAMAKVRAQQEAYEKTQRDAARRAQAWEEQQARERKERGR